MGMHRAHQSEPVAFHHHKFGRALTTQRPFVLCQRDTSVHLCADLGGHPDAARSGERAEGCDQTMAGRADGAVTGR